MPVRRLLLAASGAAVLLVAGCGEDTGRATVDPASGGSVASSSTAVEPTEPTEPAATSVPATPESIAFKPDARRAARDGMPVLVPEPRPTGWAVTSASFEDGVWSMSLQTSAGDEVVLLQDPRSLREHVRSRLDGARADGRVDLSDFQAGEWTRFSAESGPALGRDLAGTSVLLLGAEAADLEMLASYLLTFEVDTGGERD